MATGVPVRYAFRTLPDGDPCRTAPPFALALRRWFRRRMPYRHHWLLRPASPPVSCGSAVMLMGQLHAEQVRSRRCELARKVLEGRPAGRGDRQFVGGGTSPADAEAIRDEFRAPGDRRPIQVGRSVSGGALRWSFRISFGIERAQQHVLKGAGPGFRPGVRGRARAGGFGLHVDLDLIYGRGAKATRTGASSAKAASGRPGRVSYALFR